jgi:hypothetical protein
VYHHCIFKKESQLPSQLITLWDTDVSQHVKTAKQTEQKISSGSSDTMDKLHITTTHRGKSHNELGIKEYHHCKIQDTMLLQNKELTTKNFANCSLSKIYYSSDGISISMVSASLGTFKVSKP